VIEGIFTGQANPAHIISKTIQQDNHSYYFSVNLKSMVKGAPLNL